MGLIRTVLALVILLILAHVGLVYADIGRGANVLTEAVYSLGTLLESPAQVLLNTVTVLQTVSRPDQLLRRRPHGSRGLLYPLFASWRRPPRLV